MTSGPGFLKSVTGLVRVTGLVFSVSPYGAVGKNLLTVLSTDLGPRELSLICKGSESSSVLRKQKNSLAKESH